MPNMTVYINNEFYIRFLKLPDEKRSSIREKVVNLIKEDVKAEELAKEVKK